MHGPAEKNFFCGVGELALRSNEIWRLAVKHSENDAALGVNNEKTEAFWDEVSARSGNILEQDQKRVDGVFGMLLNNDALKENMRCLDI